MQKKYYQYYHELSSCYNKICQSIFLNMRVFLLFCTRKFQRFEIFVFSIRRNVIFFLEKASSCFGCLSCRNGRHLSHKANEF